jgi:hypothetical protein
MEASFCRGRFVGIVLSLAMVVTLRTTLAATPSGDQLAVRDTHGSAKAESNPALAMQFPSTGSGRATLAVPQAHQSAANFALTFRAKYATENFGLKHMNQWWLEYGPRDQRRRIGWSSHNEKYFIEHRGAGGTQQLANFKTKALVNDWHQYELRAVGTHLALYIDGELRMHGRAPAARLDGALDFATAGKIALDVDSLSIAPLPAQPDVELAMAGNYCGLYEQASSTVPAIAAQVTGTSAPARVRLTYRVIDAEDPGHVVARGQEQFDLAPEQRIQRDIALANLPRRIGVYHAIIDVAIDDQPAPLLSQTLPFCFTRPFAAPAPLDPDFESKFGFNVKYEGWWHPDMIAGVRQAGIRHVRREVLGWGNTERRDSDKATYAFEGFDSLMNRYAEWGLHPVPMFTVHHHSAYERDLITETESLRAAERFAEAAARHYQGRLSAWETMNEPTFHVRPYDAKIVVAWQKATYRGLKRGNIDSTLIAGSHTSAVLKFLPDDLAAGAYDYCDGYSFHPYVYDDRRMPDDVWQERFIDPITAAFDEHGGWRDLYITEGGWSTATDDPARRWAPPPLQRDYLIRGFLNVLTFDRVRVWNAFTYKDDGNDQKNHNTIWGITDQFGRPKLAYPAVLTLMTTLSDARHLGVIDTGDPVDRVHVFLQGAQPIVVGWRAIPYEPGNTPLTSTLNLPASREGLRVRDVMGRDSAVTGGGDVTLSGSPQYFFGVDEATVTRAIESLWRSKRAQVETRLDRLPESPSRRAARQHLDQADQQFRAALAKRDSSRADLKAALGSLYSAMQPLAHEAAAQPQAQAPLFAAMDAIYHQAEHLATVLRYHTADQPIAHDEARIKTSVGEVTQLYTQRKGESGLLPVSTAAVGRLRRYARLIDTRQRAGDATMAGIYAAMAEGFAPVARAIVEAETLKPDAR